MHKQQQIQSTIINSSFFFQSFQKSTKLCPPSFRLIFIYKTDNIPVNLYSVYQSLFWYSSKKHFAQSLCNTRSNRDFYFFTNDFRVFSHQLSGIKQVSKSLKH